MAEGKVLSFRAPEQSKDLIERYAKNNGQSMSNYLLHSTIDQAMNFEWCRAVEVLNDFSRIAAGRLEALEKESYTAAEVAEVLAEMNHVYAKQRLESFLAYTKRHCKVAVDAYLNDYLEDYAGIEAFVINNCLVKIYDSLKLAGLISEAEHAEKTAFYEAYMSIEGKEILQPREG
jgi:hypothetical protein